MKYHLLVLIVLIMIWFSTWLASRLSNEDLSADLHLILSILNWVSGIVGIILAIRMMVHKANDARDRHNAPTACKPRNRRQSYRIIYPKAMRPILIVETANGQQRRLLEYPVVDLSEDGIRFVDDGSLGEVDDVSGRIQFIDGAAKKISGKIVRRMDRQMCVCLQQGLAWATILDEQRRVIRNRNEFPY